MRIKLFFISLSVLVLLFAACENNEDVITNLDLSEDLSALIEDEVLSDVEFADLLDEGDDGIFWGDADFVALKSAEVEPTVCFTKTVAIEENKRIITFEYTGDCARSGTVIIEIYRPDDEGVKKKTVTYIDFQKRGVTFNGFREIERGNGQYSIKAEMEIDRVRGNGDSVHIERNYEREVEWLCGLDTRDIVEDNMKLVEGKCEVTKTVNGETISYSREITEPLLIVRACDLRIQAGVVEITRKNGTEVTINYGEMPDEIVCDADFECDNTFTVTIDSVTTNMEFVDGERVEVTDSEE